MQLFFAPDIKPPLHTLTEDESKHCIRVLRMAAGDTLSITDGRGNMYTCRIVAPDVRRCVVEVVERREDFGRLNYSLTLAVAPTKNSDRYEWMLEKTTETGVHAIIPIDCRHSERRSFNRERGLRVMIGAMKQSLKAYLPRLDGLTPFPDVVKAPFDGVKLIAHCADGEKSYIGDHAGPGDNVLIMIGPEGDFSPEEIALALENGFRPVSLGQSRLRTETAAIAAAVETAVSARE